MNNINLTEQILKKVISEIDQSLSELEPKEKAFVVLGLLTRTHPELGQSLMVLLDGIMKYESDTFSASNQNVGINSAAKIAAELIYNHLFDQSGCPHVDGVELSEIHSGD